MLHNWEARVVDLINPNQFELALEVIFKKNPKKLIGDSRHMIYRYSAEYSPADEQEIRYKEITWWREKQMLCKTANPLLLTG